MEEIVNGAIAFRLRCVQNYVNNEPFLESMQTKRNGATNSSDIKKY